MRHAVRGRKLGRTSAHRQALFRNQLQSLVDNERIITTLPKAKELRPLAEKIITHGKADTVPARRWVLRWLLSRDLVKKVFDEISPRFQERPGGYLRIVKLGPRLGDGAEMAVLEMVDHEGVKSAEKDSTPKKAQKKTDSDDARPAKKERTAAPKAEGKKGPRGEGKSEAKRGSTRQEGGAKPRTSPRKTV
jgi:large subunit ribosomal protein L17